MCRHTPAQQLKGSQVEILQFRGGRPAVGGKNGHVTTLARAER